MGNILVCFALIRSVYSYDLRMFGTTIFTFIGPLRTLALAILLFPSPSGGVNEPFV